MFHRKISPFFLYSDTLPQECVDVNNDFQTFFQSRTFKLEEIGLMTALVIDHLASYQIEWHLPQFDQSFN